MIKGSITKAVQKAKAVAGFSLKIEVECRSISEAEEAIAAGADIVMLDNFEPESLKAAARQLKAAHPNILIEGSGGITTETITGYFDDGK